LHGNDSGERLPSEQLCYLQIHLREPLTESECSWLPVLCCIVFKVECDHSRCSSIGGLQGCSHHRKYLSDKHWIVFSRLHISVAGHLQGNRSDPSLVSRPVPPIGVSRRTSSIWVYDLSQWSHRWIQSELRQCLYCAVGFRNIKRRFRQVLRPRSSRKKCGDNINRKTVPHLQHCVNTRPDFKLQHP